MESSSPALLQDFTDLKDSGLLSANNNHTANDRDRAAPLTKPKLPARGHVPIPTSEQAGLSVSEHIAYDIDDGKQESLRKNLEDLSVAYDEYSNTTLLGLLRLWGDRSIFTGKCGGKECGGSTSPQSQWIANRVFLKAKREAIKQAKLVKKQQKQESKQKKKTTKKKNEQPNLTLMVDTSGVSGNYEVHDSPLVGRLVPSSASAVSTIEKDTTRIVREEQEAPLSPQTRLLPS